MHDDPRTVAVVGGGFSGAILALKLHRANPDWRIVVIDPGRRLGRGLAYGACGPQHLLNVPVSRMEVGLLPGFADWLRAREAGTHAGQVQDEDDLPGAFVPRSLFGDYVEERVGEALDTRSVRGLTALRGEVVRMLSHPRGVLLADGREVAADTIVLAMGNLPPRPPGSPDQWLYDTSFYIPDPWATDAFDDVAPDEALLLVGSGLTMVDVALRLAADGHRGAILAVSRRGLLSRPHEAGGSWPEFLSRHVGGSPSELTRIVRREVALAVAEGVPWQRVFDAARPTVPGIWHSWSSAHRAQFARHLRTRWDVHRHRMAPRVDEALRRLLDGGALEVVAGRLAGYTTAGGRLDVLLRLRDGTGRKFRAERVVNCTGPGASFDRIAIPLVADLRARRLAVADPLGVGLVTRDCAVVDEAGRASTWLFAIGPLTRPDWWEITAVPEINLQIDRLVTHLSRLASAPSLTTADFLSMGEGI